MRLAIKRRTASGYVYDRRIFWASMILIGLVGVYIMWTYGFDFSPKFYVECTGFVPCDNPLINARCRTGFISGNCAEMCGEDWCKQKKLQPGIYGEKKPNGLIRWYTWIAALLVIASLFANHLIHNRGRKFEVMISIPESWKEKFRKAAKNIGDENE